MLANIQPMEGQAYHCEHKKLGEFYVLVEICFDKWVEGFLIGVGNGFKGGEFATIGSLVQISLSEAKFKTFNGFKKSPSVCRACNDLIDFIFDGCWLDCFDEFFFGVINATPAKTYPTGRGCPLEPSEFDDCNPWNENNIRILEESS